MSHYPLPVLKLIQNFSKLPGVGQKTAERLAMHVMRAPQKEAEQFARSILEVKDKVRICLKCFALSEADVCGICSDPTRTSSVLCVVEQIADMVAVEKAGSFKGMYHVLQGVLSPMNGVGPEHIRIKELISRIEDGKVQEVILATSTNVEGEATASYLAGRLESYNVKVTRIASGVPMGGDLKYVDAVTLKRALDTRRNL